ncbi:glycosyltransferase [Homoserinimonas sp. OAct 916]|uniref:glycosyltransferase n=1 Tax=Homoserinimonas sp. OAct 916 TaxID=2211450 RepID=UPI000DBE9F02|nr:nucleotide disphospho-sugar-binding domain-containing protein [Homoserinimonas sp. OAct 916]
MTQKKTFLFTSESAYGPTNNCIGIGHELLRRGHRVVFAAEASWEGKLSPLGFEEDLVHLAAPDEPVEGEPEQDAGQFWKDYIAETAPEFRKSTLEQLETVVAPIWSELIDASKYVQGQLVEIIERAKPDVLIQDNVSAYPAMVTAEAPFVKIISCNPLEKPGKHVAPVFSGYAESEPEKWQAFEDEYERTHRDLWTGFNEWVQEQGAPALPDLQFLHDGDLNLYVYPHELDYTDARPLGESWHRLDSSVRQTESAPDIPDEFLAGEGPLIYFSLGSLGSADVELMNRVISVLATLPIRVIVSKGPRHDEIELADNMFGAEFLPQTTILPLVDLVITHGGNNTVTESVHFGKPMIVLPLFWDQYDNAQRVHEKGLGRRLPTYTFTADQMRDAIFDQLGDVDLLRRMDEIGARVRGKNGLVHAADLIEQLATTGR